MPLLTYITHDSLAFIHFNTCQNRAHRVPQLPSRMKAPRQIARVHELRLLILQQRFSRSWRLRIGLLGELGEVVRNGDAEAGGKWEEERQTAFSLAKVIFSNDWERVRLTLGLAH